jgi:hypothetical protein
LDSAELDTLADGINAVLAGAGLEEVITVLTSILADSVAQETDYKEDKLVVGDVIRLFTSQYILLCTDGSDATIH